MPAVSWMKLSLLILGGSTITLVTLLAMYDSIANVSNSTLVDNNILQSTTGSTLSQLIISTGAPEISDAAKAAAAKAAAGSTCRKTVMVLAKRLIKTLNVCGKDLKQLYPDAEGFNKHFQCTIKCFMRKVELVDANDYITNHTIHSFLDKHIPPRYQQSMLGLGLPCLNKYIPLVDPADPLCTAYGDLVKCLQETIADAC